MVIISTRDSKNGWGTFGSVGLSRVRVRARMREQAARARFFPGVTKSSR
ncbi:hypothetical protein SUDANB150_01475 [Streptomyces sp. enrichment culture]